MPRRRGGARQGIEGRSYGNRTDLANNARLPNPQVTAAAEAGAAAAAQPAAPAALSRVTPLTAGTERPDEPVTHGLPFGPGAGPEALPPVGLTPLDKLKRMYRANPNPDLLELLLLVEEG